MALSVWRQVVGLRRRRSAVAQLLSVRPHPYTYENKMAFFCCKDVLHPCNRPRELAPVGGDPFSQRASVTAEYRHCYSHRAGTRSFRDSFSVRAIFVFTGIGWAWILFSMVEQKIRVEMTMWPNTALELTAVGAFRFATSCRFAPSPFGGSSAFVR